MKRNFLLVIFSLVLGACGGGGGGGRSASVTPPPGPGDGGISFENINRGLTGRLYFTDIDDYFELDLKTGVARSLRKKVGPTNANAAGEEFAEIVAFSRSGNPFTEDLNLFDRYGLTTQHYEINGALSGVPRISPDGKFIAVRWEPSGSYKPRLVVIDKELNLIREIEDVNALAWDWLPDNELVYAVGKSLYKISDIESGNSQVVKTFSDLSPIKVSADKSGKNIAFILYDTNGPTLNGHAYSLSVDGSGLRQLTTSNLFESSVSWSPDSSNLIVVRGEALGNIPDDWDKTVPPGANIAPRAFVVPASAENLDLTSDDPAGAIAVKRVDGQNIKAIFPNSGPQWRSDAPALASMLGTASEGGGVNSGLAGTVFYKNKISVPESESYTGVKYVDEYMDLFSGIKTRLPDLGFAAWPSNDGHKIFAVEFGKDGASSKLNTYSLAGNLLNTFPIVNADTAAAANDNSTMFAVGVNNSTDAWLTLSIYDNSGNLVRSYSEVNWFTWAPGNILFLTKKDTIYRASPDSSDSLETIATLSDYPRELISSNDGKRLLMTLNEHVWMFDIERKKLKRITDSDTQESTPVWSMDDKYIAFKSKINQDDECRPVYVVPADGERVTVRNGAVKTSAIQLQSSDNSALCTWGGNIWR